MTEVARSRGGANLTAHITWTPDVTSRRGGWWRINFEDAATQEAAYYRVQGSGYATSLSAARRRVRSIQRRLARGIDRLVAQS